MSNTPAPGNHLVKFPLRAVRMKRIWRLAGRNPANLHIKRMPFAQIGRSRFAPERFGHFLPGAPKFPLGRTPGLLLEFMNIDLAHPANKPDRAAKSKTKKPARGGRQF